MSAASVLVAAGQGTRFGPGTPKQFRHLAGHPLLLWSLRAFLVHPEIDEVVVVVDRAVVDDPPAWLSRTPARLVEGGATRRLSAAHGIAAVPESIPTVLIHDAARPFVSGSLIDRVLAAAGDGPAIPVVPVVDAIKRVTRGGTVSGTLDRSLLVHAQTPQGFPTRLIRDAHRAVPTEVEAPDDGYLCEQLGHTVVTVEGDPRNLKITTPDDLALAEWLVDTRRVEGMAGHEAGDGGLV